MQHNRIAEHAEHENPNSEVWRTTMQAAKRQAWKCARSQSSVVGIEHLHSISLNAAQQHSRTMGKYFYLTYDEEGYRCKFGVYNLHLLTPPAFLSKWLSPTTTKRGLVPVSADAQHKAKLSRSSGSNREDGGGIVKG
jgi:hypothetical protein